MLKLGWVSGLRVQHSSGVSDLGYINTSNFLYKERLSYLYNWPSKALFGHVWDQDHVTRVSQGSLLGGDAEYLEGRSCTQTGHVASRVPIGLLARLPRPIKEAPKLFMKNGSYRPLCNGKSQLVKHRPN